MKSYLLQKVPEQALNMSELWARRGRHVVDSAPSSGKVTLTRLGSRGARARCAGSRFGDPDLRYLRDYGIEWTSFGRLFGSDREAFGG